MKATSIYLILCPLLCSHSLAYNNGLALTPPMGWNSWNFFDCDIHEDDVRDMADALVETGLREAGYRYVNVDDCWQLSRRTQDGRILEDPTRFPSGMKALADYVHSRGLLFGMYSDAGLYTCQKRPGSYGYEQIDAAYYAHTVGIDFLKYDNCYGQRELPNETTKHRYQLMHDALNATGRPILFSMCEWGIEDPATWAGPLANTWRTTTDIRNGWNFVMHNLDVNNKWHLHAGPGGWNDPDMLEVGNTRTKPGLTIAENRAHFSLWAAIKSPLNLGNNLRTMTQEILDIVSHPEIIAINQDPLGVQAYLQKAYHSDDDDDDSDDGGKLQIWAGPLVDDNFVVILFNRSSQQTFMQVHWEDVDGMAERTNTYEVRNVWPRQNAGPFPVGVAAWVDSHDVVVLRCKPAAHEISKDKDMPLALIA